MPTEDVLSTHGFGATLPPWSPEDVRRAAAEALQWLDSFEFIRGKSTRFHVYRELVQAHTSGLLDVGSRRLYQEASLGIIVLFYISRAGIDAEIGTKDRIQDMCKGRAGDCGEPGSGPWDAQFEFLCYSIVRFAGIGGLSFAEPDLVIAAGPIRFGIPVKRVTSDKASALRARLRNAVHQLRRQRINGVALIEAAWPALAELPDATLALAQCMDVCRATIEHSSDATGLDGVVLIHFGPTWLREADVFILGGWHCQTNIYLRQIVEGDAHAIGDWMRRLGRQVVRQLTAEHQLMQTRCIHG